MPPRSRNRPGFLDLRPSKDLRNDWGMITKIGTAASLGSQIDLLRLQGHITGQMRDAATFFAKLARKADIAIGAKNRNAASPSYERSTAGASRAITGRTDFDDQYERRHKLQFDKLVAKIGDDLTYSILVDVILSDRECPPAAIQRLRDGLAVTAKHFGLDAPENRVHRGPGKIKSWRAP